MINPNDRILFQGDSITNAFRMPNEINNAYQLGAGYAMIVAAQLLHDLPNSNLIFVNRGVSGDSLGMLKARWEADCLELRPTVLSILVGVNDAQVTQSEPRTSLEEYEQQYRELLTHTRASLPELRLILCEPFALNVGDVRADRLEDVAARGVIVRRLANEFTTVLVPLQRVFADALQLAPPEYWSYDGIHPNAQGHWLIAQAWLRACR